MQSPCGKQFFRSFFNSGFANCISKFQDFLKPPNIVTLLSNITLVKILVMLLQHSKKIRKMFDENVRTLPPLEKFGSVAMEVSSNYYQNNVEMVF